MKKRAHSKSGKEEKNRVLLFPQLLRWSDYFHLKKSNSSFTKVKLQDVLNCLKFKNELYVYVNLRKKRDRDFILFSLCPWGWHECISENKYMWIHLGNTEFNTYLENWRLPFFKHPYYFYSLFLQFLPAQAKVQNCHCAILGNLAALNTFLCLQLHQDHLINISGFLERISQNIVVVFHAHGHFAAYIQNDLLNWWLSTFLRSRGSQPPSLWCMNV